MKILLPPRLSGKITFNNYLFWRTDTIFRNTFEVAVNMSLISTFLRKRKIWRNKIAFNSSSKYVLPNVDGVIIKITHNKIPNAPILTQDSQDN